MSSNEARASLHLRLRQWSAILQTFGAAPGHWRARLGDKFLGPHAYRARRQIRRWLRANGLTIVLVSAMMVFAWMIVKR